MKEMQDKLFDNAEENRVIN